jgi:hypothetical protein
MLTAIVLLGFSGSNERLSLTRLWIGPPKKTLHRTVAVAGERKKTEVWMAVLPFA